MTADERRQQLAETLARKGYADLAVLVAELGVSESTVRRDLSQLEEEGLVRRTHGGAVFVSDRFTALNYAAREATALPEKEAIGQAAAALIQDGDTVLIDGGTTTYHVAKYLMNRSLQVVTNSIPIANLLSSATNVETLLIGGYVYPKTGVALGPAAEQALANVHVDKLIMSVAGVTEEGLYNVNTLMVATEQQMIRAAHEVIVVTDHGKFGKRALARLCDWDAVQVMVSDAHLDEKWQRWLESVNTRLVLASVNEPTTRNGIDRKAES